jgi:hypothetical protein
VPDAQHLIMNMHRCLRKDGQILIYIPFIQPFHSAPYDFTRWTIEGCQHIFHDFNVIKTGIGAGPTSAFLWVFQEWVSILFSFGNRKAKELIYLIIMLISFPFKYLDKLLEKFNSSDCIASAFYIHARKLT